MVHCRRFHFAEKKDEVDVLAREVMGKSCGGLGGATTSRSTTSTSTSTTTTVLPKVSTIILGTWSTLLESSTTAIVQSSTSITVAAIGVGLGTTLFNKDGFASDLMWVGSSCSLVSGGSGVFNKSTILN